MAIFRGFVDDMAYDTALAWVVLLQGHLGKVRRTSDGFSVTAAASVSRVQLCGFETLEVLDVRKGRPMA